MPRTGPSRDTDGVPGPCIGDVSRPEAYLERDPVIEEHGHQIVAALVHAADELGQLARRSPS
jgi:hypothetical protein